MSFNGDKKSLPIAVVTQNCTLPVIIIGVRSTVNTRATHPRQRSEGYVAISPYLTNTRVGVRVGSIPGERSGSAMEKFFLSLPSPCKIILRQRVFCVRIMLV